MFELKHAYDWKAEYQKAEDGGEYVDLANLIADVQNDAIKATRKLAASKVKEILVQNNVPMIVCNQILSAL